MRCLLCLIILSITSFSFANKQSPLPVFIFAGQSNMEGRAAEVEQLPRSLQGIQQDIFCFNGESWVPYQAGVGQSVGFGPEVACIHTIHNALQRPLGIIKLSVGGTNLAHDWDINRPHSLYAKLAAKVDAAREQRPIFIPAMFWMQGERDSKFEVMAQDYGKNLLLFIQQARKDFQNQQMIFIAGRVNPSSKTHPLRDTVRSMQTNLILEGYNWIDCDDLPKRNDNLHYSTDGLVMMGKKFATTFLSMTQN